MFRSLACFKRIPFLFNVPKKEFKVSYDRSHRILILGDQDLSFALALARQLGDGTLITGTTFESLESNPSRNFHVNVNDFQKLNGGVKYGVSSFDFGQKFPDGQTFDRIVANFVLPELRPPSTGEKLDLGQQTKERYRQCNLLFQSILMNGFPLLADSVGEIHLRLTDNYLTCPLIRETASELGLKFVGRTAYDLDDLELLGYRPFARKKKSQSTKNSSCLIFRRPGAEASKVKPVYLFLVGTLILRSANEGHPQISCSHMRHIFSWSTVCALHVHLNVPQILAGEPDMFHKNEGSGDTNLSLTIGKTEEAHGENPSNIDEPGSEVQSDDDEEPSNEKETNGEYDLPAWPMVGVLNLTTTTTTPPPTTTTEKPIETIDKSGQEESSGEDDSKPISESAKTPDESVDSPGDEESSGLEDDSKSVDQSTNPPDETIEAENLEGSASVAESESAIAAMRPTTTKKPILGLAMDSNDDPLAEIDSILGIPDTGKERLRKPPSKSGTAHINQEFTLKIYRKPR